MKACKRCSRELDLRFYYSRRDKVGKERYDNICKYCLGIKNPEKIRPKDNKEEKPSVKELMAFIDEMKRKNGYFDFIDSLRLVDIFTRQNGIVFTTFSIEDELVWMWEELKDKNGRK